MLQEYNRIKKIDHICKIVKNINKYNYIASFVKDCFIDTCPKSILFGVFDGHGGPNTSNYLVKNIPNVIFVYNKDNKIKI